MENTENLPLLDLNIESLDFLNIDTSSQSEPNLSWFIYALVEILNTLNIRLQLRALRKHTYSES